MCDYSLGGLPNRLAVEGDELIVHRFPTHSIGLASPADLQPRTGICKDGSMWGRLKHALRQAFDAPAVCAICIPPGACLILKGIPEDLQRKWGMTDEEGVTFVQTSAEVNTYRDAVLFGDGRRVLLQELREGMRVKVVSLGFELASEGEPAWSMENS